MELLNISFINPNQKSKISTYSIIPNRNPQNFYGAYFYPNVCRITTLGGGLIVGKNKHLNAEEFKPKRYGVHQ